MSKSFESSSVFRFVDKIDYATDSIVSKIVTKNKSGNISLFAMDAGQNISEHTAPFDALIQVLEGEAEVIIDDKLYILKINESIVMPANIPHAVNAKQKFKMLLSMIKGV